MQRGIAGRAGLGTCPYSSGLGEERKGLS
jgi:hypothetical protein